MTLPTRTLLLCFLLLALLLPVEIYVIGDALGAGIQCPLFRYQETYLGSSTITILRDLDYVAFGIISGRSALSILLRVCGSALLIAAAIYLAWKWQEDYDSFRKPLALLVAGAGVAYLLSCIAQYGPTLYGPAGFAVPVGVPLILAVAWYIVRVEEDDELGYEGEEEYREETDEEE
ncbi:MAG TPA: hypothetical protein PLK04_12355 [Bacillota bacterium]|nr:hypothetical protein [Bacillota bacterium]HPZ14999.1 hypothetical protein [Bacillota bacterium]